MWLLAGVLSYKCQPSSEPFTNFKRDPSCAQVIFCTWPKCAVANLARTWPTFRVRANLQNTSNNCRRHHQLLSFLVWHWSFLWDIRVLFCAVYRNVQYAKHGSLSVLVSMLAPVPITPRLLEFQPAVVSTRKYVFFTRGLRKAPAGFIFRTIIMHLGGKQKQSICACPVEATKVPYSPPLHCNLLQIQTDYILFTSVHICFKL